MRKNLAQVCLLLVLASIAGVRSASAQAPLRKIGQLDLAILGLTAVPEQVNPVVPKNTATGLRVDVLAGNSPVSITDLGRLLGAGLHVEAEISGPGLGGSVTLGVTNGQPISADPLLLPIPALTTSGDYALSNVRLVSAGHVVLDVTPARVPLKVIDQVLITSVKTRPLTLEEIQQKGIVLDKKDYIGFEFTLGVKLESKAITVQLPVVFDRQNVPIPLPLAGVTSVDRNTVSIPELPPMIPTMLDMSPEVQAALKLKLGDSAPDVKIPALLVIPGNVGYLKQFFSAQLFVANGAPGGSGLSVHDVTGTIQMPPGADGVLGNDDDPLALPTLQSGPQPKTMPVRGVGPDGVPATADDVGSLNPGEQGQAEFLLRGEKEGFHTINFAIDAILEGLPVGPTHITGKASGGVLVRNPFFDLTFAVPSVVRKGQRFKLGVTVNNIGQGTGNNVSVSLDSSRMSGVTLQGDSSKLIDTLKTGDAKTLTFEFVAERTGQVVASYLHFDPGTNASGSVSFTLGVGDRGVALSPDTFVLPAVADALPPNLVDAALRVLGQAWSVANAHPLPPGVFPITRKTVTRMAQGLAEAGLRVTLGGSVDTAVRDLGLDYFGASGLDEGFDQLMRTTDAGQAFTAALATELAAPVTTAGGVLSYQQSLARLAASNGDQISFAVTSGAPTLVSVSDAAGHATSITTGPTGSYTNATRSTELLSIGSDLLGVVTDPTAGPYTVTLQPTTDTTIDLAVALPRPDGTVARADTGALAIPAGRTTRVVLDTAQSDALRVEQDLAGDGEFTATATLTSQTLAAEGASLVSATIVGPEIIDGASDRGFSVALLFDRRVKVEDEQTVAVSHYTIPLNAVMSATPQLSGRLVFATLAQPEGPYVPTTIAIDGIADLRGTRGPATTVAMAARLTTPGAVITGHMLNADGTPIPNASVVYSDNAREDGSGFALVKTDARGQFGFRYVINNTSTGEPWYVIGQDPSTGDVRYVVGYVRYGGEQVLADIVLIGRGTVTGTVRDLAGKLVGNARVTVVSQVDPQLSGATTTDGDGKYTVSGIGVGAITVGAAQGLGVGHTVGRLDRAGTTTTVNVTIDSDAFSIDGTVRREADGFAPVPGAWVVYRASGTFGLVPIAVTQTDVNGHYAFKDMPAGTYKIDSTLDSKDVAFITGIAAAGDDLHNRDLIVEVPDRAHVTGVLKYPNGSPGKHVVVALYNRGVYTNDDGTFDIPDVPIQLGVNQTLSARLQDGSRSAQVTIQVNDAHPAPVTLTLSSLGNAQFTVLDTAGHPMIGLRVELLAGPAGWCAGILGVLMTDANGQVTFHDVKLGTVTARAFSIAGTFVDLAFGTALVTEEGQTGVGAIKFKGAGSVTGTVYLPNGSPAQGADVTLQSNRYNESSCSLGQAVSHHVTTGPNGQFNFIGVNVGPVGVTATHPFLTTSVGAQSTLSRDGDTVNVTLHLVDTTAGALTGTVFLPDGHTVAGAGVEVTISGLLPDYTVKTDDSGHYAFAKILPAGFYLLVARDPVSGGVAVESIYMRAGQDSVHNERLLGRGKVTVRVVDGGGTPIDRAFVQLYQTGYPAQYFDGTIEPSNGGVITFEHVTEGGFSVSVRDTHGRGGRGWAVVAAPDANGVIAPVDLKVSLTVTGSVTGHFYMPDGTTAIPYGTVTLVSNYAVIGRDTTDGTGDDIGAFSFDFVPAGPIRIEGFDPLTARTGIAVGQLDTQDQHLVLDVKAQGLGVVLGTVFLNGDPQPGAHVSIVAGTFRAATTADVDGHYMLPGVPEGNVVATASLDNLAFLSGTAKQTLIGDGTVMTLDVHLHDSGAIDGVVYQADGTTVAPPSRITVQIGGFGGTTLATTSAIDGTFHFERVPSGFVTINADEFGSIDAGQATVDVPADDTANVGLTLLGIGSISGVALDSQGNPIGGDLKITGVGPFPYTLAVHVNADGAFRFPEVLAGPFTVAFTASVGGLTLRGSAAGTVVHDANTDMTISLQDSGTVTGLVMRSDGTTPALGANVSVRLNTDGRIVSTQVQADGRFTIHGVPLSTFSVSINDPFTNGLAQLDAQHLVSNGQTVDVGTVVLDDTVITVLSIVPPDGTTNVTTTQHIVITFNEPVSQAYIPYSVYIRKPDGNPISLPYSLSADGKVLTLLATLPDGLDLTVQVTTNMADIFGRHVLQPAVSHLHTADITPPSVTSVAPANGTIQLPVSTAVTVTFTEPLSASTNLTSLVTVTGPSGAVAGTTVLTSPTVALFTPTSPLAQSALYTVTVNGQIDVFGNTQTHVFTSTFATVDTVPPTFVVNVPTPNSNNKFITGIQVTINDAASGPNGLSSTMTIDGTPVANPQRYLNLIYYSPPSLPDGNHTVVVTAADMAGNTGSVSFAFKTDTTPPNQPVFAGIVPGQIVHGSITLNVTATDAVSGVQLIDVYRDFNSFYLGRLIPPASSIVLNTMSLTEGAHNLYAYVYDNAGNFLISTPIPFIVDNIPITVTFNQPLANARFRDSVDASVTTSEVVDHLTFTVGPTTVTATANGMTYTATIPLAALGEQTTTLTATAYGLAGDVATASRTIVVDRTAPAAPDPDRIDAEPPIVGNSAVTGRALAVEGGALVIATNTANGAVSTATAAADGSFWFVIPASVDDALSIVARDSAGNQGPASIVVVREVPELVLAPTNSSLHYEGVLVDKVGTTSGALTPDGSLDAVFTFSLSIGSGITRTLSYIEIVGPTGTRSTRVGVGSALGVAADAGSPLLNNANGTVGFPITGGTVFTLFGANNGFIVPGGAYTATAAFTDGSLFSDVTTVPAPEDVTSIPHAVTITATPATITGTASVPGSTQLVLSDIRDINGTHVADGSKIAISAMDMATTDARGGAIHSAGGTIVDGIAAANNANFKVFTVSNGTVVANYTMSSVTPAAVTGTTAVVQIIAADSAGNILGHEAIGTIDLNLRAPADRAIVAAAPASLYADKVDRRSHLTIQVRDANGNLMPDGTRVGVTANAQATFQPNGSYVPSAGGTIIGGTASATTGLGVQVFTVTNGVVTCDYSSQGIYTSPGQTKTAAVSVVLVNANNTVSSQFALGTANITLAGPAAAEVLLAADAVAIVAPARDLQFSIHHIHDVRAGLVPDGAWFGITANSQATFINGSYVSSAGGVIQGGTISPTGLGVKAFQMSFAQIGAAYNTGTVTGAPGTVQTANLQMVMVDPASYTVLDQNIVNATPVKLVAPTNAVGTAQPSSVLADGALHTSSVTFSPVLDAFGNAIPDGSKVIAVAAAQTGLQQNGQYVPTAGGQIVDGGSSPSGSSYKVFTVQNASVTVTYGDQGLTSNPGQTKTANVMLLGAKDSDQFQSQTVLGIVPVTLAGVTTATITPSPSILYADGGDRRSQVTVSDIRDAAGQAVPDGTQIAVTASPQSSFVSGQYVVSYGGTIVGGTSSSSGSQYRVFSTLNGQIQFDYSTTGINPPTTEQHAAIQILSAQPSGTLVSQNVVATANIRLLPAGSAVVSATPVNVLADAGDRRSQITISNLVGSDGVTPIPDGARVALTAAGTTAIDPSTSQYVVSAGGQILSAGVTAGDGTAVSSLTGAASFTVAGGQVQAIYSDSGVSALVNETKTAHISVVPLNGSGAYFTNRAAAIGTVLLRGTTSATASGPATLAHGGATGTVTFSGIKDSAGNTVPDGTLVVVTANGGSLIDTACSCYNASIGGTISGGSNSSSGSQYRVFAVQGGSVSVTYTTPSTTGTARVQIGPAKPDGSYVINNSLIGGVWAITVQ